MDIVGQVYDILYELGFYDYGEIMSYVGDILGALFVVACVTLPIVVCLCLVKWVCKLGWYRDY